tara:strand:+ start:667 stop:900 length:234 start_codon:yes stop_codon:yes gene_type:complete
VPEHSSDDRLTSTPQRSRLDNKPLSMSRRIVVPELGDLALLIIHLPPHTSLWCVAINKWPLLAWHQSTMANDHLNGG